MVTRRALASIADDQCPVRQVLAVLGDRWSHAVIYVLGEGDRRFSQLHRQIPDVSKKMLAQTLDRLQADGLVARDVAPTRPPSVSYSLTPEGRVFLEPVLTLYRWGVDHAEEVSSILKARAAKHPVERAARS